MLCLTEAPSGRERTPTKIRAQCKRRAVEGMVAKNQLRKINPKKLNQPQNVTTQRNANCRRSGKGETKMCRIEFRMPWFRASEAARDAQRVLCVALLLHGLLSLHFATILLRVPLPFAWPEHSPWTHFDSLPRLSDDACSLQLTCSPSCNRHRIECQPTRRTKRNVCNLPLLQPTLVTRIAVAHSKDAGLFSPTCWLVSLCYRSSNPYGDPETARRVNNCPAFSDWKQSSDSA